MIAAELEKRPEALQEARDAARGALQARRALWDGAAALLRERHSANQSLPARRLTPVAA
jgi:hypothetical protein